jgi:hypothetical protein
MLLNLGAADDCYGTLRNVSCACSCSLRNTAVACSGTLHNTAVASSDTKILTVQDRQGKYPIEIRSFYEIQ